MITVTEKVLPSGVRAVSVYMENSPTQTTMVLVRVGSNVESDEIAGMAHFLEHMGFKGTTERPTSLEIARSLDLMGAHSNAFTDREMTGYYTKTTVARFSNCINILADVYQHSTLPEAELQKEKGVIVDEIRMYNDDPKSRVDFLFEAALFPGLSEGRMVAGSFASVRSITRNQMDAFRKQYYTKENTVIVVAGGVPAEEVFREVEKSFALLPGGGVVTTEKVPAVVVPERIVVDPKPTEQTHLIIGARTVGADTPDRYAITVLATILGGNMSSRLFQKIREELGLGYYVSAHQSFYKEYGIFSIAAGMDTSRAEETVAAILTELRAIQADGPTTDELHLAKEYLENSLILMEESNESMAMWYGARALTRRPLETPESQIAKIKAVTIEDVKRVATDILLPSRLTIASTGSGLMQENLKALLGVS